MKTIMVTFKFMIPLRKILAYMLYKVVANETIHKSSIIYYIEYNIA